MPGAWLSHFLGRLWMGSDLVVFLRYWLYGLCLTLADLKWVFFPLRSWDAVDWSVAKRVEARGIDCALERSCTSLFDFVDQKG